MPLSYQVLGTPGTDNALFVKVDTGQSQTRLLFDCGDGCPHQIAAELREVDHLCFSHLHMDHVSGFDLFFRVNFDRTQKENHIWVPHGSREVIQHRFQGFMWNLVDEKQPGEWRVHEISPATITTTCYRAREGFSREHVEGGWPWERDRVILDGNGFTLEAILLDHGTPSLGYVVREAARVNVDTDKLSAKGMKPGPWVKRLRGAPAAPGETVAIGGMGHPLGPLQAELLTSTPGESIAYLTDFRMTPATSDMLAEVLQGVNTVVCECQYRASDADLADAVMHSTSEEVAAMAAKAGVGKLILFHFSGRYDEAARREMLQEARAIFANATLPEGWF